MFMITPSFKEFIKLSRKGNVIPVYREIDADLDTPVSAFLKLGKSRYAFLLESVEGREKIARYSFLGAFPEMVFESKGGKARFYPPGGKKRRAYAAPAGPLEEIRMILKNFRPVETSGLPRFSGGLVGYIGYDAARFFEDLPDKNPDDLGLPEAVLMLADTLLVFDHVNHKIKIVSNAILGNVQAQGRAGLKRSYRRAAAKIDGLCRKLSRPLREKRGRSASFCSGVSSNFTRRGFESAVGKAKAFIRKGDIIQAVLSQRFALKTAVPALEIYRNLRSLNPSPYMYYLKLGGFEIIGASPEMLVRSEDGEVETRPIAGTRPRGKSPAEDKRLAAELLADKKEKAEHLMLVDLGRNDLGKVCRAGSVEVSEFMSVEKFSHVMHIVSSVRGKLCAGRDSCDVLKAAFPAGTVSGSPKIRAMEIIDELENLRRGPYAGCVGYFSFSGNLDTCITIRTIVKKGKNAYIQAGAGIVADSRPAREYRETVNKAKALIEAINKKEVTQG